MSRKLLLLTLAILHFTLGLESTALGQTTRTKVKGISVDPNNPRYTYRIQHSRDGIGKFYMGREIAHVMGHLGAGWLERSSREVEETIDWNKGASSTEVSRVWAKEGAKRLLELKNRRFDDQRWGGLMLDGIRLSKDLTAVVALGITEDGQKIILGFGC